MNIPKYVYHLTHKNNLESIVHQDALISTTNMVYVCPTKQDIAAFAPLIIKTDLSDYVLLKIDTLDTISQLWDVSRDHNESYIAAKAFVYHSSELPLGEDFEVEIFTPLENIFPYL